VNEKIEGFFDICHHFGLTGSQGVVVPAANARDLMLRTDVVEACRAGRFRVWAVDSLAEALTLFTGRDAGAWDAAEETYPPGSLLDLARTRAHEYWRETYLTPGDETTGE
jgi:predicted ATP-dependent protease